MNTSLRDHFSVLAEHGEASVIDVPVDMRYVSAVIAQAPGAVLFNHLVGYDLRTVGGVLGSRKRLALAAGCPYPELWRRVRRGLDHAIEPVVVSRGPVREVVRRDGDVDLTCLPITLFNEDDGGPYISAGLTIARDPEYGLNAGFYRLMFRDRRTLSIAIGYRTSLADFYRRAMARGDSLEVAICIGTHPIDSMAGATFLPLGQSELALAGGIRGEPLELSSGVTVGVPAIANAEIVIEGEIPPIGWTVQEGKFPEFHGYVTGVGRAPIVRVRSITHRRDAMLYALQMPMEDLWLTGPPLEALAWRALERAGITPKAVYATPGGCAAFHVVASIEGPPGAGRKAVETLLGVGIVKHAIVTDSDIDVYDPEQVEWAVATRFQADRDLVVLTKQPGKAIDPSILVWENDRPFTAKVGFDATISTESPRSRYQRIVYPYADDVAVRRILAGQAAAMPHDDDAAAALADLRKLLQHGPAYFRDLLDGLPRFTYRAVVEALGRLSEAGALGQDGDGRYHLRDASPA